MDPRGAGPGRKTPDEFEAEFQRQMPEDEARAAAEQEQAERDRLERAAGYDPELAQVRLALLEEQGILTAQVRERDEVISRELFPAMEDTRRDRHLARLRREIAAGQNTISWRHRWVIRRRCAMRAAGCPPSAGTCR